MLNLKNSISIISFFLCLSIHSQTIESITFSSAVSSSDNFQPIVGIPYGVSLSGANGSIEISSSYGEGMYEQSTLSTIENKSQSFIKIFPNPTTYLINVDLSLLAKDEYSILIFDSNGKQVYNLKSTACLNQIDVSNFMTGTYYLTVDTKKLNKIEKFKIIKHK
jgi:hypothetical protein